MFTIDIHTHILPREIPKWKERFGYGGFIQLEHHTPCRARMVKDDGTFFREIESNCWDPHVRLTECDRHQVHVQVLSTVPVMFSYWARPEHTLALCQFLNDHLADLVHRFPKRFVGLGTLPMQAPHLAVQELERCKKIGLKGVQIGTNVNQKNLGEPEFFPVFEACSALQMAIFVHPWEMMGQQYMSKYWLPWLVGMPAETARAICSMIFSGVFEKLPALRVAFAHGGGSFISILGRIQHGYECRPDLVAVDNPHSPEKYLGKIYFDSLVHDSDMLHLLIKKAGVNRVALGSDYPFPLGETAPGSLIRLQQFSDEQLQWLFHKSALEWLSLNKEEFL
jgi:aminocarboxymuconate-semialdehyde decarboxylase